MLEIDDRLKQLPSLRRARNRWLLMGVLAGAALAVVVALAVAWWQARQTSVENPVREAEFLAKESSELLAQGDRYQAVQVALGALPHDADSADRPFVPAAQMALEDALGIYSGDDVWAPSFSTYGLNPWGCAYGENGLAAACDRNGTAIVFDANSGTELHRVDVSDVPAHDIIVSTGRKLKISDVNLFCLGDETLVCYSMDTGEQRWRASLEGVGSLSGWAASPDGRQVAAVAERRYGGLEAMLPALYVIDVATGDVRTIELEGYKESVGANSCVAFDEEGRHAAVGVKGNLFLANLDDGSLKWAQLGLPQSEDVCFHEGSVVAISTDPTATGYPVRVQAFDAELKERWSYDDAERVTFNRDGAMLSAPVRFCTDAMSGEEGGEPRVFALLGGPLVGIDSSDGRATLRLARDAPIVDATVKQPERDQQATSAGSVLIAATSSGEVIVRDATSTSQDIGGEASFYDTQLGEMTDARFMYEDGILHLLMWTYSPDKCRSYVFGGRGSLLEDSELTGTFDADSAFRWNGLNRVALTETEVQLIDEATLAPTASIALADLEGLGAASQLDVCFSEDQVVYVYGPEVDEAGERTMHTKVFKADKTDGSILTSFVIEDLSVSTTSYTGLVEHRLSSGEPCLVAHDIGTACILSTNGEELLRVKLQDGNIKQAWIFGDTLLTYAKAGVLSSEGEGFAAFDVRTGEEREPVLAGYLPWDEDAHCIDVDEQGMRLLLACSDGVVRLFDMQTNTVAWETSYVSTGVQGAFLAGKSKVLLQDERGCLMLVSAEDGTFLRASSVSVPLMDSFGLLEDGTLGVGHYEKPGLALSIGLVMVSVDEAEFGPLSLIRGGGFLSRDATRVAIWDTIRGRMVVTHRLSLEQLCEMADVVARARPLTEAERRVYQVE